MRRIAALAMSTLVSLGAVATLAATPATAGGSDTRTACPAAKKSKASKSSGMDMDMGHGHSTTNKKKSAMANCPTVAGAREIALEANAFSFSPADFTVEAGEPVTIVMSSTDLEHDLTVRKYGHVVHAKPKKTARGGLVIDTPGTYKFWCTIKGHRAQGMVGTLTVTPATTTTTAPAATP